MTTQTPSPAPGGKAAGGEAFGSYRLIRQLGRGGFAEVWEAESVTTGRRVALKILTDLRTTSSRSLERFHQEGRLAASLFNPRCVYVFDAGEVDGIPFISMELMRGGTLADRLRGGPVPVPAAVDCVLDMLDGLEAAHAAGIIHRDIKPSNVFLDEQGRARIGDFGISKSLEAEGSLSVTGAFLGTPQYASPEQAAGELLDYRSDLYAAGAVLYELLAGRPPFGGENPAQALARVLTQPPAPFTAGARVPRGLQRVVLRLLAKQKEKRYTSHQALRDALLPFSSRGQLGPADLARRVGAIVLDFAFQLPLNLLLLPSLMAGNQVLLSVWRLVPSVLYFTLTDRYLDGSPGKQVLGLRVVSSAGPGPTLGRVALRSAIFLVLYHGPSVAWTALVQSGRLSGPGLEMTAVVVGLLVGVGLIACTMRRANGYAGVHELASRTRVVVVHRGEARAVVPDEPPDVSAAAEGPPFGPFRPTRVVWRDGRAAFVVARDDELHRDIWIHVFPDWTAARAPEELQARGEGSLHWLQRGRGGDDGSGWDAYGAPGGIQLARWVKRSDRPGWRAVRMILQSVGRELMQRETRAEAAGRLSPSWIWVARSGNGVLLDFPPEGPAPTADGPTGGLELLRRVARLGLEGADPVPIHARALLERLEGVGPAFTGVGDFVAALDGVATRPATVVRRRRVASLLTPALLPALIVLLWLALPAMLSRFPPWFRDLTVNRKVYVRALRSGAAGTGDSVTRRSTESIQIVLAAALEEAGRTPGLGNQALAEIPPDERALLDSAARRHPAPAAADVDSARAWLVGRLPSTTRKGAQLWMAAHMLGTLGIVAVILAVLLRGPLLLHLFGMAVVRRDGARAGRLRCGIRSVVAWSPLIALPAGAHAAPIPVQALLVGMTGLGVALSVLRPERGPADRIVGTVLVPK